MKHCYCISTLLLLMVMVLSCRNDFDSMEALNTWINNPENGMTVCRYSGDKILAVRYVPASLSAYKDIKDLTERNRSIIDSVNALYANSRTFLLTIKYKENAPYDPAYEEISNYGELCARKQRMHFSFDHYITLITAEGNEYKPVLTHMEETYGLQKYRNIHLVFSPQNEQQMDILKSDKLDIVFDDRLFNTGIHHFVFKKKYMDDQIAMNLLPHE